MATLQEMLEQDLGLGVEKVASVSQPVDGMDKLAMELGLFGDMTKTAEPVEHKEDEGDGENMDGEKEEKGEKKEASMDLSDIYSTLFPEDSSFAVVKTAEEQKQASVEEVVGKASYDFYKQQMDNRIEKLAMDMLQGKFAAEATSNGNGDAEPIAAIRTPNNRAGTGPINTTPQKQGDLGATNGPADIGHEQMVTIKAASADQQALMSEMFTRGQEMACEIADQMDKMAAEASEKVAAEELGLDDEGMKIAAVCGAFIERGQFEKLAELGQIRYGDPKTYFYPYIEEKVAALGASAAVQNFSARLVKMAEEAAVAAEKKPEHKRIATHVLGGELKGLGVGGLVGGLAGAANGAIRGGGDAKTRAMHALTAGGAGGFLGGVAGATGMGVKRMLDRETPLKK